jgi:hypothetical protein
MLTYTITGQKSEKMQGHIYTDAAIVKVGIGTHKNSSS